MTSASVTSVTLDPILAEDGTWRFLTRIALIFTNQNFAATSLNFTKPPLFSFNTRRLAGNKGDMKQVLDFSKELQRKLANGKTFDQALAELRMSGASIMDCIASIRNFHKCGLEEAKRRVESSSAWSDVCKATEDSFRDLTGESKP
jgi:hypothetical protein